MATRMKLDEVRSLSEFENNYWYARELKEFTRKIGVANSSRMRKPQLEVIIREYILSGFVTCTENPPLIRKKTGTDQLVLETEIKNYVSNKATKSFILSEALKRCPDLPKKSGVWYWTNRWREEKISKNQRITYKELVEHFIKLSSTKGRLPQIPSARFNNFISDFLMAKEGSRDEAVEAWEQLKKLEIPKTFTAWKDHGV